MDYNLVLSNESIIRRFWSKVEVGEDNDCWNWKSTDNGNGYGVIRILGRYIGAHRLSYILSNGGIPDGLMICHKCNNRACCNPKHLYAGTAMDNMMDARAAGTIHGRSGKRPDTDKLVKGEDCPWATISNKQAVEISNRITSGEGTSSIAKDLGVSCDVVYRIKKRKSFRSVIG